MKTINKRLIIRKRIKEAFKRDGWYKLSEKSLAFLADTFDDNTTTEELDDFIGYDDNKIISLCEVYRK